MSEPTSDDYATKRDIVHALRDVLMNQRDAYLTPMVRDMVVLPAIPGGFEVSLIGPDGQQWGAFIRVISTWLEEVPGE